MTFQRTLKISVDTVVARSSPLLHSLALGLQFGISAAVPLLLFVLAGRFLDRVFGTSPLFLIIGVVVSLFCTVLLIARQVRVVTEDHQP